MTFAQISELLNCRNVSGEKNFDMDIQYAFASDLMSDILVDPCPGAVLLTGLANVQAVRTCKIARACAVILCKRKTPSPEAVKLAHRYGIPFLVTDLPLFDACGILYANGIRGIPSQD